MKLLGKLLERSTERELARERALVEQGWEVERRMWARGVIRFWLGLAVLLAAEMVPEPWDSIFWGIAAGMLAATAFVTRTRASAYRSGWLSGRMRIVAGFAEADSGEEFKQVLQHAAEYDTVHVMGLPHHEDIPDSPEGL